MLGYRYSGALKVTIAMDRHCCRLTKLLSPPA
jgi:hypothetical protein